jgi:hypothetical protein
VLIRAQKLFCKLTGLDERGVSLAMQGLERSGLLQISGPRNAPKYYRLLRMGG